MQPEGLWAAGLGWGLLAAGLGQRAVTMGPCRLWPYWKTISSLEEEDAGRGWACLTGLGWARMAGPSWARMLTYFVWCVVLGTWRVYDR